jgi:hypothetical protein
VAHSASTLETLDSERSVDSLPSPVIRSVHLKGAACYSPEADNVVCRASLGVSSMDLFTTAIPIHRRKEQMRQGINCYSLSEAT